MTIPSETSARENSLKKGKWALQFEIDRDFDLSGFQGNTLSIKTHTADNRAYRLGFTVFFDIGDSESFSILNDTIIYPRESNFNSKRIDINLQKVFYASTDAAVNLFYGLGTAFSLQHSTSERESFNRPRTIIQTYNSTNNAWAAGLTGILGAEWFFAENMSLLGEYTTFLNYNESIVKSEFITTENGIITNKGYDERKGNSFRLSSSSVKFGLSVYF